MRAELIERCRHDVPLLHRTERLRRILGEEIEEALDAVGVGRSMLDVLDQDVRWKFLSGCTLAEDRAIIPVVQRKVAQRVREKHNREPQQDDLAEELGIGRTTVSKYSVDGKLVRLSKPVRLRMLEKHGSDIQLPRKETIGHAWGYMAAMEHVRRTFQDEKFDGQLLWRQFESILLCSETRAWEEAIASDSVSKVGSVARIILDCLDRISYLKKSQWFVSEPLELFTVFKNWRPSLLLCLYVRPEVDDE